MSTDEQNQAWREHLQTLIADGVLTPMTERPRLPGCKCAFPSQAPANHATNCIHYRGDTTMSDPQPLTTLPGPVLDLLTEASELIDRFLPAESEDSIGGVVRTMKPLNPDGEMELLLVVDGHTASVWLSREWWQAATPDEWKRENAPTPTWSSTRAAPGIHQAAMVARMARTRIRIYTLSRPADKTAEQQQPIADRLAADAHLWKDWAEWCQATGYDDAGHEYEELAEDCMRAVVAWQGGDQ